MRKQLRNIALNLLGSSKSIGNGLHILNSHYISREDAPTEVFYNLLKQLNQKADFIKIEDAVKLVLAKEPINQKLIAFTFDDGFEECYTKISPVLNQFNTNAAYFINPGFINGDAAYKDNFTKNTVHIQKEPMTWEMIKKLHADGFVIGNHTMDHAKLVQLSEKDLEYQILSSKKIIESELGVPCEYFAWTYGKLSDIDENALKMTLSSHKYVFSGDNYKKYFSHNNQVINRRHIEGNWPMSHVNYFLSHPKSF